MHLFVVYFDGKRLILTDEDKMYLLPKKKSLTLTKASSKALEEMLLKLLAEGSVL